MPRAFAALLAVLLTLSLALSACQPSPVPTPPPVGTSAPAATPTSAPHLPTLTPEPRPTVPPLELRVRPEALKGLQIYFWHGWSGETARKVQDMVTEFNRENVWGIKVEVEAVGGTAVLFDRVNAALAAGEPPALVAAPLDYLANWHGEHDAVVDLNLYIDSPDWGLTPAEIADFSPLFWQETEIGGHRLGIPADRSTQVLFYNQTWARELGFDQPPVSTGEFQLQACAAAQALVKDADKANDGMGGWIIDREAMTLLSWMAAYGASQPAAGASGYTFNSPEAAGAFAYLRSLFDAGCAWLSRNPLPYEYFASRQALFYAGDLSEIALQQRISAHLGGKDQWTVLPFPSQIGKPVLLSTGSSYAILDQKPAGQLAAWLLLRWMILPRNQARLVQAGLTLPVGQAVRDQLDSLERSNRQWAGIVGRMDALSPAAALPTWWLARNILEDAGWQMLQPTVQSPAAVLKQLDDTLADILKHQSQP